MTMPRHIVVTGATGFVGRALVPRLHSAGVTLTIAGRDPARVAALFPNVTACGYDTLAHHAAGAEMLVHLATLNNDDLDATEKAFETVNVDLFAQVLDAARSAGVATVVNISSTRALDPSDTSPYARSKRAASRLVQSATGSRGVTLYLAAIHHKPPDGGAPAYAGKLRLLEKLPAFLRPPAFSALAALRPTLSVDRLAAYLLGGTTPPEDTEIVLSDRQSGNPVYAIFAKIVDLAFAVAVLGLFWWGLLAIWVAIRLDSPGPGFFLQPRVGKNGRVFTCYKFRTMRDGTIQRGTHEVSEAQITRIGAFMRRTKIDELPQIWNLIRGELSLVGPRPCLIVQEELIAERRDRGVLDIKPGITGLAQIAGIDMSDPVRLAREDARYLGLRCIPLDLKIILATFTGKGSGDRVERAD